MSSAIWAIPADMMALHTMTGRQQFLRFHEVFRSEEINIWEERSLKSEPCYSIWIWWRLHFYIIPKTSKPTIILINRTCKKVKLYHSIQFLSTSFNIIPPPPKFNIAPEKLPSQHQKVVVQTPFFRGQFLKLRVFYLSKHLPRSQPRWQPRHCEDPTARNSKRLPQKGKGAVRLRSSTFASTGSRWKLCIWNGKGVRWRSEKKMPQFKWTIHWKIQKNKTWAVVNLKNHNSRMQLLGFGTLKINLRSFFETFDDSFKNWPDSNKNFKTDLIWSAKIVIWFIVFYCFIHPQRMYNLTSGITSRSP